MGKVLSKKYQNGEGTSFEEEKRGMNRSTSRESGATSGYYSLNHESTVKGDYEIDFQQDQIDLKAGLNLEDKEKVLHNFRFLKGELDADILCDYFYQDNYFSTDDLEDVKSEKTRHEQVDFLLRKLLRLKPEAYLKFLEYLEDAGYNYVRKVLEESVFSLALNHEDVTETEARLRLKQFQKEICEQMQPDVIADMFLEYEEFTLDEYEEVIAEKTRRRKSEKILGLLKSFKHIERGFLVLLQALKETDGLYLYRLLKDGGAAYAAMQDSRHTVNVKVKVDKVKKRESKSKTAFLKEEKQCRVTLEVDGLESDQELEVKITRVMQNPDVMVSINDNIIIGNECLIGNVEQGSIVIILKGCSATSLRRLFAKDVERPISDILHHIFIHPDIVKLLTTKKLKFKLTLSCQPTEQKEQKTNLERIKSNLEFLVEELDALTFLKKLKEENVLSKEDEKEILETTPTSRKTRTRAMLQKLIDCNDIETFINILKEKKEYVWKHVFQSGEEYLMTPANNYVASSYRALAENMNPKRLEECCSALDTNHCWSREKQAKYILQQAFVQDLSEQSQFIKMLSLFEQIPPQIVTQCAASTRRKGSVVLREKSKPPKKGKRKTDSGIVFVADFTVSAEEEESPERKRGMLSSLKRSLSRRSDSTARRDGRNRDSAYSTLHSTSSTNTMNNMHSVNPS